MGPLLLMSALLAAAPLHLTVSRNVGMAPGEVEGVALRLRTALERAGVGEVERLSQTLEARCGGENTCLHEAVRQLEGRVLLEMELAWVAGQLGAHLSASDAQESASIASHRFIVDGDERYQLALDAELVRFAELVKENLPPELLQQSAKTTLSPAALEGTPQGVSTWRHPALKKGAIGVAAASGVAAALFGSLGLQSRHELERSYSRTSGGERVSTLDQQSATALAGTANARLTGALISSGLALGFAGVAVWLELQDDE